MLENAEYIVEETTAGYAVVSASGSNIMMCSDKGSAEHYAAMLNKAFNAGYKQALRDKRGNNNA